MLALTESVLFFLDLAFEHGSKRLSLDSRINDWIGNVYKEKNSSGSPQLGEVGMPADDTFSISIATHNKRSSQKRANFIISPLSQSEEQADDIFGDELEEKSASVMVIILGQVNMDDVSSEYDSPIRLEAARAKSPTPGLKPRALDAEVVPDIIPSAPKRKLASLPSVSDSEPNSPPASDDETASISDLVPVEENSMRRTTSMTTVVGVRPRMKDSSPPRKKMKSEESSSVASLTATNPIQVGQFRHHRNRHRLEKLAVKGKRASLTGS